MLAKRCRPYFQVLDSLPALFAKGLARVTHTQPASYYAAVLSSETLGAVLENERAAYYDTMVEDERGDLAGDVGDSLSDGAVGSDDDGGDFILPWGCTRCRGRARCQSGTTRRCRCRRCWMLLLW